MRNILFAILLVTALLWFWGLRRAATLFTLRIREGRVVSTWGRLPPRLLQELVEIIDRAGVVRANVRCVVRDGRPVLLFDGEMSPGTSQSMRNVLGQFTVQEIRNGRRG